MEIAVPTSAQEIVEAPVAAEKKAPRKKPLPKQPVVETETESEPIESASASPETVAAPTKKAKAIAAAQNLTKTDAEPNVSVETVVVPVVEAKADEVIASVETAKADEVETHVETAKADEEEEEDEEIITIEVMIDGKLYLKDDDGNLYDIDSHEFIRNVYE